MFNSSIIEIVIGLAFIYLLLSLICTSLTELISRAFAMRSENLKKGIENLLAGTEEDADKLGRKIFDAFYLHPLIKRLSKRDSVVPIRRSKSLPSYIPSNIFARTLLDIITNEKPAETIKDSIGQLDDSEIRKLLQSLNVDLDNDISKAKENLEKATKNLECWYDESMDRISGWYARKAQLIALVLALIVSIGFNVDSFLIFQSLKNDPILAKATADFIESHYNEYDPNKDKGNNSANNDDENKTPPAPPTPGPYSIPDKVNEIKSLTTSLYQLNLPIGWAVGKYKYSYKITPESLKKLELKKATDFKDYKEDCIPGIQKNLGKLKDEVFYNEKPLLFILNNTPIKSEADTKIIDCASFISGNQNVLIDTFKFKIASDPRSWPSDWFGIIGRISGWLITAIAVSLGAPFWYDALNKLVNMRAAGKKPKSTAEDNKQG